MRVALLLVAVTAVAAVAVAATALTDGHPRPTVLVAAGDIASCSSEGDEATAALVARYPRATVATLGDNAYPSGSRGDFEHCYAPTWGRVKGRTQPAPGNHEYSLRGATGYFGYFGRAAGPRDHGWYSYDLGAWHVVVLNSNCSQIGGCHAGSPQERWLRRDLSRHGRICTLAYWHHPRFSSGVRHGAHDEVDAFWRALYDARADVVLSAHEHNYERFAPQTPDRRPSRRGIRQFVVGTGGADSYAFGDPDTNSRVRITGRPGILELRLNREDYRWRFRATPDGRTLDRGSARCVP